MASTICTPAAMSWLPRLVSCSAPSCLALWQALRMAMGMPCTWSRLASSAASTGSGVAALGCSQNRKAFTP